MTHLAILALCVLVTAAPQQSRTASEAAFAEVASAYKAALAVYDQARVDAARGRGPAPTEHPAVAYWARMSSVADAGSASARQWLCENVAYGVREPARRLAVVETQIEALLSCCAGDLALLGAISALRSQVDTFGADATRRNLDAIVERATNPEVRARAMLDLVPIVAGRVDSADLAQVRELREAVVVAFPQTRAAREAADFLNAFLHKDLARDLAAWLDRVESLVAQGVAPAEWPRNPCFAYESRFVLLASANQPVSKSWVEGFLPSVVQSEKLATDLHLSLVARAIATQYPVRDATWTRLRMRMLGVAARLGGAQAPWLRSAIGTVSDEVQELEPLAPLSFTDVLLALPVRGEVRGLATWVDAQTRILSGFEAELERALARLESIPREHADLLGLAEKAAAEARGLRAALPGAPLPDSRTAEWGIQDIDNLEVVLSGYKGSVLLVEVFDPEQIAYAPLVAERRALVDQLAGRPFAMVGLATAAATLDAARRRLSDLGVTWRCGLLQARSHPYLATLYARRNLSVLYLVDAEGVIRARNRPFEELARMARELTAEAERQSPRK